MKINELLEDMRYRLIAGTTDREITSVEYDSRKIVDGSAFIAVKGQTSDGHDYIGSALSKGAALVVVNEVRDGHDDSELKALSESSNSTFISVPDSRKATASICAAFYGHPEKKLHMIGITGTKGKTTISFMIHDIMSKAGKKTGLIGTVCNMIGDEKLHSAFTTPESRETYELLSKMAEKDTEELVMEVSSLGLKYDRVYGLNYDVGCFTNLYEDHIGGNEHPDMEDYIESKLKMFEQIGTAVINKDCSIADRLLIKASECDCKIYTYGLSEGCDVRATGIESGMLSGRAGTFFDLESPWHQGRFFVAIPGEFNVYNALCSISAAYLSGADTKSIEDGLSSIEVPGRLQHVSNDLGITILVDYAHNAASLENVLDTLKGVAKGKVITVFGCGGDRSHTRRFEMGEVAGKKSDYTIITSDNPRTEDPLVIIGHIESAISKTEGRYEIVVDRAHAIRKAIEIAEPDDIVLIAGKGHEDYQIFADRTIHFDDCEVALEAAKSVREERS
ncbi:MAG: UDP-N-acetylmuramoyl-L-alanyl-D-glutamate--2,6-diaminopimelate ligase [Clostridiales bacterium]|nr:UDP-N-acetylmuramoyl-L-alanyl-D-glutamate--2,6-diaminopimelate ligase [Clostridiales bacterium]